MSSIDIGLAPPGSWFAAWALALAWLAVMWGYSPVADRLATQLFSKPPDLSAFRALQQSRARLVAGIVVAWVLGGLLEELALRGILLQTIRSFASHRLPSLPATAAGIVAAAVAAWIIHLYQGLRAALIIAQLSVLFGVLFVIAGYDLWPVILCHGLYDTIAFIRFANKRSKYADLDGHKCGSARFQ
jgi:membrane protease YdiL (CAAX protease family)